MHGDREGRTLSSPPPSMLNDESNRNESNATATSSSSSHNQQTELAYLPIGCSVSAKYRGAFCSAQVKAIEKQVKLKVTLLDSGDAITISEEQIVSSAPLRIGNTVTVRLQSSNRRQSNDSNSHHHYARSGLAAFINQANPDEKQATIKQIIDNSIYTVVFNDGDEKSLRRSSLCLQGVRLYQTQYGQQKILEEIPTSMPASPTQSAPASSSTNETTNNNLNDITSIVIVKRQGNSDQQVFPALILKRKALADYMWIRSFVDGREYVVHTRDDVQSYSNVDMQALCRSAAKQATQACEKFLKYNQTPAVWQKKKRKSKSDNKASDEENSSSSETSSSESDDDDDDDDDIDEETTEEKDSFVAQLLAFMDDRGTPINNIPKVQNCDLDLHRLFKIVRMLGGYNKVTKNDQWGKVHIKMGLPDETSSENGHSIEHAYKKYLFAYEDLSKKLGSMNAPNTYLGGRTSMSSDSRRSLIRLRQQQNEEEKNQKKLNKTKQSPAAVKHRGRKSNESSPSIDSKPTSSAATKKTVQKPTTPATNRKGRGRVRAANVLSSSESESESDSESETSDDETSSSSSEEPKPRGKPTSSTTQKKPTITSSATPKKTNQITSSTTATAANSSSTPTSSVKNDIKKSSTTTKNVSSSNNDSKQSKLTITIPIAKPKSSSSMVQSTKKPSVTSSNKDEKKKVSETKSLPIKTEPKSIPSAMTKKSLVPSSKIPQLKKTNQQPKQSTTSITKPTSSSSTSSSVLPHKTKTNQPQNVPNNNNNNNNNNKDRSTITSKPTSSIGDGRQMKTMKTNTPTTKTHTQERSASTPIKKTKPTANEESTPKSISSAAPNKIPKLSANTDSMKKSTANMDKIPKKQVVKEGLVKIPKISDSTSTNKTSTDQATKAHTASPTRSTVTEPVKTSVQQDPSSTVATPASPSKSPASVPPSSLVSLPTATSVTNSEIITSTTVQSPSANNASSSVTSTSVITEVKPSLLDTPSESQTLPQVSKDSNENESIPINKRPHTDDHSESTCVPSSASELCDQLSPSKRLRRSLSSQESVETISSSAEHTSVNEHNSTNRNVHLTYEDILVNDTLSVTWGNHGTKQYPARCIEKNDEKKELLIHYTGWNSRHDEWVKLDRIIERKDLNNSGSSSSFRQRRISQINTGRQQSVDLLNTNDQQAHIQITNDTNFTSTITEVDKLNKNVCEVNKIEESDIDDNSQEHNECKFNVEPISSAEDETLSCSSLNRVNQLDIKRLSTDETSNVQQIISTVTAETDPIVKPELQSINDNENNNESLIQKRRQSRAASSNSKIDQISNIKTEQQEEMSPLVSNIIEQPHQYPLHVKEETIDGTMGSTQFVQLQTITHSSSPIVETVIPSSIGLTSSSPTTSLTGTRRTSIRQIKRRSGREPNNSKDASISTKKKMRIDNGHANNVDMDTDKMANIDQLSTRSSSTEQQLTENPIVKRSRPVGRRGGKKSGNQQDFENDDFRSSSPSNVTMRQQLKEMFKHRTSRYNFLDLNNNLTGDERITHLKDRMRECQKVFFNLKSALVKIEKQRKVFIRKQKPLATTITTNPTTTIIQTATTEILKTSACT